MTDFDVNFKWPKTCIYGLDKYLTFGMCKNKPLKKKWQDFKKWRKWPILDKATERQNGRK